MASFISSKIYIILWYTLPDNVFGHDNRAMKTWYCDSVEYGIEYLKDIQLVYSK